MAEHAQEPQDAEVVDGTVAGEEQHDQEGPPRSYPAAAPVDAGAEIIPHPAAGGTTQLIVADSPTEMIGKATEIATVLKNVLEQQNLTTRIGPKDHVDIEGWQTLATLLGAAPVIRYTRQVIDPATGRPELTEYEVNVTDYEWVAPEGGGKKQKRAKADRTYTVKGYSWEACCDVYKDGAVIASAESMVTRNEDRWAKADDYAIRSMAQTRAQSRAIAAAARWVVTLAGYSGTPSEEMDGKAKAAAEQRGADQAPAGKAFGPEASDDLKAAARNALKFLEAGPAGTRILEACEGYMPRAVAQSIVYLAVAAKANREQDTAAEAPDADAEAAPADAGTKVDEGPAPGTVPADDPDAEAHCICPEGFLAAEGADPEDTGKRDSACPIANHGIPF